MSIKKKISVISIVVGVTFLGISTKAMENNEKREESQNSLNKCENIINIEKEKSINEIKKIKEELKGYGYGVTKGQQQRTKEWIESWGFDSGAIYKKMQTKKYRNILECLKELMMEQIEKFRIYIKEFRECSFYCRITEREKDYYDNFYEEQNEGVDIDLDEETYKRALKLIKERNLNEEPINSYIEEDLPYLQETLYKISNYAELIEEAYNYYIYKKDCRFIKNGYFLKKGDKEKYYNIYTINSIEALKEEYEEMKKEMEEFEDLNNSDEEEEDIKTKDEEIDNSNNEAIKWAKNWIDMWGGSFNYLSEKKQPVNIEDIKKYLKKIVIDDYNIFNKILERFEKYKFEFNEIGYEKSGIKDEDKYNNFKEELKQIIDRENKEIEEEYGILVDPEVVKCYIAYELVYNKTLQKKIKNYMQLIKKAYIRYINYYYNDKIAMQQSNMNLYKFLHEGYNLEIENGGISRVYRFNKKGKIDIYKKEAKEKLKTEYKEMQLILEIRTILEKIKKRSKKKIGEECFNILNNIKEGTNSKKNLIQDSFKIAESKRIDLNSDLNILKDIFGTAIKNEEKKKRDYFIMFVEVLKQSIEENIFEELIDEMLNLTKEEYYPERFVEKFKEFIFRRYKLIYRIGYVRNNLKNLLKEPNDRYAKYFLSKISKYRWGKRICFDDAYLKERKKEYLLIDLEEYLKKELKRIELRENIWRDNFFEHYYTRAIINLISKHKLTFFEHFKTLIEKDFKKVETARDIAILLENIIECEMSKKYKDELIEKVGQNISEEHIKKLKIILKYVQEDKSKFSNSLREMISFADNFLKRNFLKFEQSEFFKGLEKVIEKEYEDIERFNGIKQALKDMQNSAQDITRDKKIKREQLNNLIKKNWKCYDR